ncbi:MAG: hypothetical protein HY053_05950 [Proteobacteria bacterium]|nr:hypothetical protein [Pseudomonadota bacterium]
MANEPDPQNPAQTEEYRRGWRDCAGAIVDSGWTCLGAAVVAKLADEYWGFHKLSNFNWEETVFGSFIGGVLLKSVWEGSVKSLSSLPGRIRKVRAQIRGLRRPTNG